MEFKRLNLDIDKVNLIPRPRLFADGSYIAFNVVGEIDTNRLYIEEVSNITLFKYVNGIAMLEIKCKHDRSRKRYQTIRLTGKCTKEESDALNELYCAATGTPLAHIVPPHPVMNRANA